MLHWVGQQLGSGLADGAIQGAQNAVGSGNGNQAVNPLDMFATLHRSFKVLTSDQHQLLVRIKTAYHGQQEHFAAEFQQPLQQLQEILGADTVGRITHIIQTDHSADGETQLQAIIDAQADNVGFPAIAKKIGASLGGAAVEKVTAFLGEWWEQFRSPEPRADAFDGLLRGIALPQQQQQEVQLSSQQVAQALQTQSALLAKNSVNKGMAIFILQQVCGIPIITAEQLAQGARGITSEQVTAYIEEANRPLGQGLPPLDFQTILFREIDAADNVNPLRKLWAKACYVALQPLANFYSSHLIFNLIGYGQRKMASFQNGHFILSLNNALGFMNGHVRAVEGAYRYAARPLDPANPPIHDVNEEIRLFLQSAPFLDNMTPQELYTRVAEVIVDRFTPVANLRENAYAAFASLRIPENSPVAWLNYPIAFFLGFISILLSLPLYAAELLMNNGVRWVLKKIAARTQIIATLVHSSHEAIGFGKAHKHAMNKFLVRQLERAWALMNPQQQDAAAGNAELDLAAFARNLPDQTKEQLRTLVSTLFTDVGYQLHAANPAKLRGHIEAQSQPQMPDSVRAILEAIGVPVDVMQEAQTTTVQYLAFLLHMVLRKETLDELALTSLQTANESAFSNSGSLPTDEEMRSLEARRDKLLNDIVAVAIRQAVNAKFYPMRRIQAEADTFVAQTKAAVAAFTAQLAQLSQGGNCPAMKTLFEQLVLSQNEALKAARGSPDVPNSVLTAFDNEVARPFVEKLTPMDPLLTELTQYHATLATARAQQDALTRVNQFFTNLQQADLTNEQTRAQILQQMQTLTAEVLPQLAASHPGLVGNMPVRFQAIREALSQLQDTLDRREAANVLLSQIQPANPQSTPAKRTLRNSVNGIRSMSQQARAAALAVVENSAVADMEQQLQQWNVDLAVAAGQAGVALAPITEGFNAEVTPLLQQQQEAIAAATQQIEQRKAQIAQLAATLGEWGAALQNLQCPNPFPIDLTALSDLARAFVVKQISAYSNSLPLFFEKDFNWEAMMHRGLVEFIHEQQNRREIHLILGGEHIILGRETL